LETASPVCSVTDSISRALSVVETVCQTRGVQFTPMRKLVLQTLWEAAQPLGAYNILKRLEDQLHRRVTPPTVYRALDFLLEQRFISKLESRNAYVPCANFDHPHACIYFICENCGASEEIEDRSVQRVFERKAGVKGFRINRSVIELQGLCSFCLPTSSILSLE